MDQHGADVPQEVVEPLTTALLVYVYDEPTKWLEPVLGKRLEQFLVVHYYLDDEDLDVLLLGALQLVKQIDHELGHVRPVFLE